MSPRSLCIAVLIIFMTACRSAEKSPAPDALFVLQDPAASGISFINSVKDTKEFNIFKYRNFYNGAGVAIGDVNNDGRPDIFFTSNQGENKLYLNRGNWKFEDITAKAGISSTHHWHTGVTIADVNADGWLDIYVCNSGQIAGDDRANELYINQGNGTFREQASAYGLDDRGQSTQAVFFDYDHDGDLDCFVLNNSNRSVESFGYSQGLRSVPDPENGDRLYRNDAGKFTNVTAAAGIYSSAIAYGLGITVGDLNNDGWEDIYISNDFFERDYLYINQKNGTFREVIEDEMGHTSQGSMGSDMADINNDGYLDIFTTEMLPESDTRLKTTIKFDDYDVVNAKNSLDFHHQFTSNCLQLNNQDGTFSEVAQYAGIDATGWSWGALAFDFDNDGWKDLLVCNGIQRDLTNQDFLDFFGSRAMADRVREKGLDFEEILSRMPSVPIANCAFINNRDLTFRNRADSLGLGQPGFSNGAAYADLDGDGDLDLVINNVNSPAFVYRNMTTERSGHHYLKVRFKGDSLNRMGIGARVTLYSGGRRQMLEQMPSRGFQSSVNPELVFGLGSSRTVDSLLVRWPKGEEEVVLPGRVDTTLIADQKMATGTFRPLPAPVPAYRNISATAIAGSSRHIENNYVDFKSEPLIPRMLSAEGPKLASADVDGDGRLDFFVGGAQGDTGKLFIQNTNGQFVRSSQPAFDADRNFETVGAVFFDADGDGDSDLVMASGGNQHDTGSQFLITRLYLNDGKGHFVRAVSGWPFVSINASCVRAGDFDGDGKIDLFIGARNIPGKYGVSPSSVLLRNEGKGMFSDVTASLAPELKNAGMVTDACWKDLDGDGKPELIVVGDWMPVTVFGTEKGTLKKIKELPHSSGWWNCLTVADINGDGQPDLIAGNFGLNSRIRADTSHPASLYVADFNHNGHSECIPVYYKSDGKSYPYFMKGEIEAELPFLKKKFLKFEDYAGKGIADLFSEEQLKQAAVLHVEEARTCVFINDGKGSFHKQPLDMRAQFSPVYSILAADLNGDKTTDLFLTGNFYGIKPQGGRFDANYGTVLINEGNKNFRYSMVAETGLQVKGEGRDILSLPVAGQAPRILVAVNDDKLLMFGKR